MLVYGDPKFCQPLSRMIRNFETHFAKTNPGCVDDLRSFLIEAGQLEQAASDGLTDTNASRRFVSAAGRLTDGVAALFCRRWLDGTDRRNLSITPIAEALSSLHDILSAEAELADMEVTVKIPEGFAFYSLYPEQYCAAALAWGRRHSGREEVVVVGIRSIGTTLSAVVKETLLLKGWKANRITVRPAGHPFERRVQLDAHVPAAGCVLVVDEGPGISGSSMAAVAEAFTSRGTHEISFLPGHNGEPGASAGAAIRAIWNGTPRYVTRTEYVKWNGLSWERSLAVETEKLNGHYSVEVVENLDAGRWREFAFERQAEWPACAIQFERRKFLCAGRHGPSILWKFAGLHCNQGGESIGEATLARLSLLATAGFGPAPLGVFRGFVAVPWIGGKRLSLADGADPCVLNQIGRYIVHAAEPGLAVNKQVGSIDRLSDMLYWNTKEVLGDTMADRTSVFTEEARQSITPLSYGDGRLMPHEWIRTGDGAILKVDGEGHNADHTLIGHQSILWDVAGAFIEWDLNDTTAVPLLMVMEQNNVRIEPDALIFYQQAYAAFRLGLLSLGMGQTSDVEEKRRLRSARDFYLDKLARLINGHSTSIRIAG
jgi:hypothetical protein